MTTTTSSSGLARIVEWVADFGPLGGSTGLKQEQYAALVARSCNEIDRPEGEDVHPGPQWSGAANACRAAFRGRTQQWRQAEDDLAKIKGRTQGFDCLDLAAYHMLAALVSAHRTAPDARIVVARGRSGGPCPRITSVTPSHGDSAGGYRVTLVGINLPAVVDVHFGDVRLPNVATVAGSRAFVIAPPRARAVIDPLHDSASIWPEGWWYEETNTAQFDYIQDGSKQSVPTVTGTATGERQSGSTLVATPSAGPTSTP